MFNFLPSWIPIRIHWPDRIRIKSVYETLRTWLSIGTIQMVSPQLELTVARRWAASPSYLSFYHSIDHAPARPLSFCSAGKVPFGAEWLLSDWQPHFFKISQPFIFKPHPPPPPPNTLLGNTRRKQFAPLVGSCILITMIRSGFCNSNKYVQSTGSMWSQVRSRGVSYLQGCGSASL